MKHFSLVSISGRFLSFSRPILLSLVVMSTIWCRQTKRHTTIDNDIEMYAKTLALALSPSLLLPHTHTLRINIRFTETSKLCMHFYCNFTISSHLIALYKQIDFADSCICNLVNHSSPLCAVLNEWKAPTECVVMRGVIFG